MLASWLSTRLGRCLDPGMRWGDGEDQRR